MSESERWKTRVGLAIVFALGSGLFALHLVHAVGEGESFQTFLLGILIPMGFTAALLIGAAWLRWTDLKGSHTLRIASWCLVGCGVFAIGAVITILYEQAEGVVLSDQLFVVVNAVSAGSVVGFVVGVYDVRQRIARTEAIQLSRQLTVLNRVLRHDIRNGANVIHGRAELLSEANDPALTDEIREHVELIQQRAIDLVELGDHAREIEQLLQETNDERECLDIATILEKQLQRIRRTHPNVAVVASVPDTARVYAHPLVGSAIANVLDNAVEHNEGSSRRLQVDCTTGPESVEVRIADNGSGMNDDEIVVLERGYETPLHHTSGIGLWLVNWIVSGSDGDVWFEENSFGGSTVCLRFDLCDPANAN